MAAGRRQAGSTRGGTALTRDQVLDAALQIVETEGSGHLTVRALARKLGVAVTAVYWHVGDKQAVLDGLVERIIAGIGEVTVRGRGTEARLMSTARSLRRTLLEYPDLVALVHRQGRTAALFQPARRVLLRELAAAGITGARAALGVQSILSLVVGSVLIDRQVERQPVQRQETEDLWTSEDLPEVPDAPGLLRELTHHMDEEKVFDYSLRVLVRSITGTPR